jgi:hypothetical protein
MDLPRDSSILLFLPSLHRLKPELHAAVRPLPILLRFLCSFL